MARHHDYPSHRKPRRWDQHGKSDINPGRDTDAELTIDPRDKEIDPDPDPDSVTPLRPQAVFVRVSGGVALPSWDVDGHALKDELALLLKNLSNRPAGQKGTPSGQYIALDVLKLPNDATMAPPVGARSHHNVEKKTLDDAYEELLRCQGQTVRELTFNLFGTAGNPLAIEPRTRSLLHRLKLKGWGEPRYDEQGVQRWYVIHPDGMPKEWRSMERAIAYTLAEVLGGRPGDYTQQVGAISDLIEAQGERASIPDAWIVPQERPF